MTHRHLHWGFIIAAAVSCHIAAYGQSSSLYVTENPSNPRPLVSINGVPDRLSPQIAQVSMTAVRLPEPREFAIHDLITIIVRESIENDSESEITTEKDAALQAAISAFPSLRFRDLLNLQVQPSSFDDGTPELEVNASTNFEGTGEYDRKDTFTTRITARIIDIKPNATLVLEARKFIQSDDESVNIILTGTCRKDDIASDNTILSTQLYDLRLVKEHEGELRNATKKGLITKFFELIFNF